MYSRRVAILIINICTCTVILLVVTSSTFNRLTNRLFVCLFQAGLRRADRPEANLEQRRNVIDDVANGNERTSSFADKLIDETTNEASNSLIDQMLKEFTNKRSETEPLHVFIIDIIIYDSAQSLSVHELHSARFKINTKTKFRVYKYTSKMCDRIILSLFPHIFKSF